MTKTYYRTQTADRDPADLLDPGWQFSHAWSGSHDREGVSVCDTLEDLALYLASHAGNGIPVQESTWVIVELEADTIPGAMPVDPEFETLVRPTTIVSVRQVDAAFMTMIAESAELLASFDAAPEFDD